MPLVELQQLHPSTTDAFFFFLIVELFTQFRTYYRQNYFIRKADDLFPWVKAEPD